MSGEPPLIAHVVYRFAIGGLENGTVNLINRLPADDWRHAVIALTDIDRTFAARIGRSDVALFELHKGAGHALPLYPELYRLFRSLRPAIVHTRNLGALEATIPAWAAGVRVRVHGEHGRDIGDLTGANVRRRAVRRLFSPFVTRYVAVSPDLAQYLSHGVGVAPGRVEQIVNGVDTQRFRPRAAAKAAIPGCPFDPASHWIVAAVGRMEPVKDHATLAHAFVLLRREEPELARDVRLAFIGGGETRASVEAIVTDAGMREFVWFAGERHDVADVMQGLDCFVLPSLAEGISNTILEAMATALPVVATRVGANAELVADRVTGRLVPAADPESMASAIGAYRSDPDLACRHGRNGRDAVTRKFSIDAMVDRYGALYSSLAQRRSAAVADSVAMRSPRIDA